MGHKINPVVFRLGGSNNWQYNLKEEKNWITSYLIYQLVRNQFMNYTLPHFNHMKKRNKRHSTGLVEMFGESQVRTNSFLRKSMLFSHIFLGSRNGVLNISCFFYDYFLMFKHRPRKFGLYNQLFSNQVLRWVPKRPYFRSPAKSAPYKLRRWLNLMGQNFWLYNLNLVTMPKELNLTRLFLLTKIWLRLFDRHQKVGKKENLFYLNILTAVISALLPIFNSLGMRLLTNRLYFILIKINLWNLNFKLKKSLFFLELFRRRYFVFKGLSKSIGQNLRSMLPCVNGTEIKYHAMREKKMSSTLLTNLILVKLGQYYRIDSILYPLTRWIQKHRNVLGYRIIVSGRLTRRERASHIIKSGKSMPYSSLKHKIDYNQDIKITKFGMVGIKVYLFLKKKLRNSYYFLKFSC